MPYLTSIERHRVERGLEQGELIGQIRLYQEFLGQQEQPCDELDSEEIDVLQPQLLKLQQNYQASH